MGRAVTCGQIADCYISKHRALEERQITLPQYKKQKMKIMKQLGYIVPTDFFNGCANEIQVDNRARTIIFG